MDKNRDTILIIDDNPTNLAVLFDSLEESGYRVLIDTNAETALEAIKQVTPNLILLDIMMPGIDGFETCRRLKTNHTTQDIPVIFMTALTDTIDEVKGLELGAVDYIAKPIQVETVLARIKTHLAIRKLQQQLEQQNAELDAFARTVAHDLKNPLSVVVGYTSYLAQYYSTIEPDELTMLAENVDQTTRRAINIIDELLLLAGVRKQQAKMKPINMGQVVEQSKERLAVMITNSQAEIILPKGWPTAWGYAPWVEEVWTNYISNGIKYGGVPPHIELGATSQNDGAIRFWIKDNGLGLTSEAQATLFTEFTRLEEIRIEGHGLGLSIVRRIIEKLNGQVGVESEIGKGSIFYFTLPGAESTR